MLEKLRKAQKKAKKELAKSLSDGRPPQYQISSSAECINECVEMGKHFCLSAQRNTGVCCTRKDQCLTEFQENVCSYEAPKTSASLKWFVCPHTPAICGPMELFTGSNKPASISPTPFAKDFLKGGAACRYEIVFPNGSATDD